MTASLPTALMTPRPMMTVEFSRRGPDTGTTVAPRIAKYCGSPPCAQERAGFSKVAARPATTPSANQYLRNEEDIPDSLVLDGVRRDPAADALVDARG